MVCAMNHHYTAPDFHDRQRISKVLSIITTVFMGIGMVATILTYAIYCVVVNMFDVENGILWSVVWKSCILFIIWVHPISMASPLAVGRKRKPKPYKKFNYDLFFYVYACCYKAFGPLVVCGITAGICSIAGFSMFEYGLIIVTAIACGLNILNMIGSIFLFINIGHVIKRSKEPIEPDMPKEVVNPVSFQPYIATGQPTYSATETIFSRTFDPPAAPTQNSNTSLIDMMNNDIGASFFVNYYFDIEAMPLVDCADKIAPELPYSVRYDRIKKAKEIITSGQGPIALNYIAVSSESYDEITCTLAKKILKYLSR